MRHMHSAWPDVILSSGIAFLLFSLGVLALVVSYKLWKDSQ